VSNRPTPCRSLWLSSGSATCREFRHEPPDAPWETPATFDAIYEVATAKGIPIEF